MIYASLFFTTVSSDMSALKLIKDNICFTYIFRSGFYKAGTYIHLEFAG